MPGLADILQGILQLVGTKVPGAPMAPGAAGPPNPSTTSYLPAIETGLSGLAGLLAPQGARRTWGGAIGNALAGGLQGYNAGENQLTEQQKAVAQAQLNQQALAKGALEQQSNQAAMNQYGTINPAFAKLKNDKAEAAQFATSALQIANDPKTNPTDKAFWLRAASFANAGGMDAVAKFTGIEKDRISAQAEQAKLDLQPLEKQKLQAQITHEGASTAHEAASTAHLNRMGEGEGRGGGAGRPATELGEARREYLLDTTDRDTGLPRDDAPAFDDWLVTEWPKRRATIGGARSSGAGTPSRSSPTSDSSLHPPGHVDLAPESVDVPGLGRGVKTRIDEKGRPIYRFPDGKEHAWNRPKTS